MYALTQLQLLSLKKLFPSPNSCITFQKERYLIRTLYGGGVDFKSPQSLWNGLLELNTGEADYLCWWTTFSVQIFKMFTFNTYLDGNQPLISPEFTVHRQESGLQPGLMYRQPRIKPLT